MKRTSAAAAALLLSTAMSHAQFVEDGIRLTQTNGVISARAGAIGSAYSGIADDFAALYYNPAGLMFVPKSELTLGVQLNRNQNTTNFFSSSTVLNGNSEAINAIGFVSPLKFGKTKAAIAVGYMLESDFDDDYKTTGRGTSSIVNAWIASPGSQALARDLYLSDSVNGRLVTPLSSGLSQTATVLESGGLHSISGGIGIDVAPTVSIGFTLHGKWGSYSYDRRYTEADDQHLYETLDTVNFTNVDFSSLRVRETVDQEISGIGASFGIMGKVEDFMRFGITVRTPSYYSITENYARTAQVVFDNGGTFDSPADGQEEGRNSYEVVTPFVFNTGLSFNIAGLTIAGSAEYSDLSQIEFSSSLAEIEDLNIDIAEQLTGQLVWGIGAEYENEQLPVAFRAGLSSATAIYNDAPSEEAYTQVSAGAGLYFAPNIRMDAMYSYRTTTSRRVLYNAADAAFTVERASSQFAIQFIYRF